MSYRGIIVDIVVLTVLAIGLIWACMKVRDKDKKRTTHFFSLFFLSLFICCLSFHVVKFYSLSQLTESNAFFETSFPWVIMGMFISAGFFMAGKDVKYSERELEYSTNKLNALAKSKLHDIRNNYIEIGNLVRNNEFSIVKKYVDSSAFYYSILLNNWERLDWTLKDEWDLLEAYNDIEAALGNRVMLVQDFEDIRSQEVLFPCGVLTTLLNNSVRHGFKHRGGAGIFNVRVIKKIDRYKNSFLAIEVTDNGNESDKDNYIKDNKTEKGLSLLQRRIKNEFLLKKVKQEKFFHEKLSVHFAQTGGTIIKFVYPYATIKDIAR